MTRMWFAEHEANWLAFPLLVLAAMGTNAWWIALCSVAWLLRIPEEEEEEDVEEDEGWVLLDGRGHADDDIDANGGA